MVTDSELIAIAKAWSADEDIKYSCPRCGCLTMDVHHARNAVSRVADIAICDLCGTSEAVNDWLGRSASNAIQDWVCVHRHFLLRFLETGGKSGTDFNPWEKLNQEHRMLVVTPDVIFDLDDEVFRPARGADHD